MLITAAALVLASSPMLEVSTLCEQGFGKAVATPACAPLLEAYSRFLAVVARERKPESLTIELLKQEFVPGRVLLASGWSDGGHRRLERLVLRELDGTLEVVWLVPEPRSDDGEHQLLTDVWVSGFEPFLTFMKSRETPDDFGAALPVFQAQLRSVRSTLVAKVGEKPSSAKLLALTGLLMAMLEKTTPPKALSAAAEIPSKAVQGLLSGKAQGASRWVGAPEKFEPLVVKGASVRGLVWGGADENWLLHVALTVEPRGFTLERRFIAYEQRFIE